MHYFTHANVWRTRAKWNASVEIVGNFLPLRCLKESQTIVTSYDHAATTGNQSLNGKKLINFPTFSFTQMQVSFSWKLMKSWRDTSLTRKALLKPAASVFFFRGFEKTNEFFHPLTIHVLYKIPWREMISHSWCSVIALLRRVHFVCGDACAAATAVVGGQAWSRMQDTCGTLHHTRAVLLLIAD